MNYKICRIETLEELIEEHRNISRKFSVYEFDETSYTLLLIEINKVLKENQQLKEIIDKAIKYIEKNINQKLYTGEEIFDTYSPATDLLNILETVE